MQRETMSFDVVIVGAGPAGLTAAIRLAQLSQNANQSLNIAIVEKGVTVGAHILSGAVLEPHVLNTLLPNWQESAAHCITPATEDQFLFLTEKKAWRFPVPLPMRNTGNYIISLGSLCRVLAQEAENLGVNIFPGFAAVDVIYENDRVTGIVTGDQGVDKNGTPKAQFQAGVILSAKQIILAEGCRGSLTETIIAHYGLRAGRDPQTYGLGLKEIWEVPTSQHHAGQVTHSIGWPLDQKTYGGSFVYHAGTNRIAIGFVVGLDYRNPYLNPYETFQLFKTHPSIANQLQNGRCIAYGARTLIEGGLQSLPKLSFPGGVLVGDAAGFLNVPKIKGIHAAMQSAILAAESIFPALAEDQPAECVIFSEKIKSSSLWEELYRARNIRPAFRFGLWAGLAYAAIDTYLFRGKAPWTLHHARSDRAATLEAKFCQKITYPKHDAKLTFDLATNVYLANITHGEDQPVHLKLKDKTYIPIEINLKNYAAPETRYCPAGVYEIISPLNQPPYLQINSPNCIHCKACDIKDPTKNIIWTPPEGGSGPQYEAM